MLRRTYLRNDSLRLRFEFRDGEFVQRVGTELPELEFVDFTGEAEPEAACRHWIDEASERVLPLDGPLTHAAVLVDRTDSFLVYACFHHAVGDGWSVNLAMSQLFNEYVSGVDPLATTTSRCRATWTSYAQSANTAARRSGWPIGSTSSRITATLSPRCSPAADRCVVGVGGITPCG